MMMAGAAAVPVQFASPSRLPSQPRVSPDGKTLSFISGGQIMLQSLESTTPDPPVTLLASPTCSAGTEMGGSVYCWSADSKLIFFVSNGKPHVIDSCGGVPRAFKSIEGVKIYGPAATSSGIGCCFEDEKQIGLCKFSLDGTEWPVRLSTQDTFNFDIAFDPTDESRYVYHAWSHPNMSWDESTIKLKDNNNGTIVFAGGSNSASAQPRFSPNGEWIAYLNDASGWLNLYVRDKRCKGPEVALGLSENEEGAYSTWSTGASVRFSCADWRLCDLILSQTFCWLDNERIVHCRHRAGACTLYLVSRVDKTAKDLTPHGGVYSDVRSVGDGKRFVCLFESNNTPTQLYLFTISDDNKLTKRVVASSHMVLPPSMQTYCVAPRELTFATSHSAKSHGLFYPTPLSPAAPVIMFVHGGPTGMSMDRWNPWAIFFNSRGWSMFFVNHTGSIGYGRKYREGLNQKWGLTDVSETRAALAFLRHERLVSPSKAVVMGGSAGGFTTLNCLLPWTEPSPFAAGIAMCPLSNLYEFSKHTHLYESHYNEHLVPRDVYRERSPYFRANEITTPLLMFHGLKDTVVDPEHSRSVKEKVKGPVQLVEFPDEAHMLSSKLGEILETSFAFLTRHVINT